MDADLDDLLRGTLRSLMQEPPADIATALADLGWAEVLDADPEAATGLLFSEQGSALASTAALDGVAARVLGLAPETRFVWPGLDSFRAGGPEVAGGVALAAIPGSAFLLSGDPAGELDPTPAEGFAAGSGWLVTGAPAPAGGVAVLGAARLAVAEELLGVGGRALREACDHVGSRHQFGRPIGSYQSVRHRLAGAYAELAGAEAAVRAARADPTALGVSAKAAAGRACGLVAAEAVQVCGGMGLSAEHPVARCARRTHLLDAFLGRATDLTRTMGAGLLRGDVPALAGSF
jgi:hypothetical protein